MEECPCETCISFAICISRWKTGQYISIFNLGDECYLFNKYLHEFYEVKYIYHLQSYEQVDLLKKYMIVRDLFEVHGN